MIQIIISIFRYFFESEDDKRYRLEIEELAKEATRKTRYIKRNFGHIMLYVDFKKSFKKHYGFNSTI